MLEKPYSRDQVADGLIWINIGVQGLLEDRGGSTIEAKMKFRDILAIVPADVDHRHVLDLAQQLSIQNSGRLSVLLAGWLPIVTVAEGWTINPLYAQLVDQAREDLKTRTDEARHRLASVGTARVSSQLMDIGAAEGALSLRARHADLAVVSRPSDSGSTRTVLDAVLFGAGRPVLMAPPQWKAVAFGRSVLVAWKPTREAARALADADDFVTGADRVSVVTVDAGPDKGYGAQPGADIAEHLAFRGCKTELFNLHSAGRSEAQAILDQAMAIGADLIVMGAYGRARLREFLFGGVTRDIVESAGIPVLLSH